MALQTVFPPELFDLHAVNVACDYQAPEGYAPLVKVLEARYGAPVVITAGAKQGLSAAFYAARCMGLTSVAMRTPFWSQMPAAIKLADLGQSLLTTPVPDHAYLMVSPNNPDGHITTHTVATYLSERCKMFGVPLIHDAAYHTSAYVADPDPLLVTLSDVAIFSAAKMYGLSGLRVGWVVCNNPTFKQHICEYVEATTVGVSLLSQKILYNIVNFETQLPDVKKHFENVASLLLANARTTIASVDPEVLDTTGVEQSNGMFGWFKMGPKFDPDAARIHIAPGSAFGDKYRVRINLAVEPALLCEAVKRLNQLR
jgi:aspartate/methionine/tyrosine aminotransferase